jgi:hypothetical protein
MPQWFVGSFYHINNDYSVLDCVPVRPGHNLNSRSQTWVRASNESS